MIEANNTSREGKIPDPEKEGSQLLDFPGITAANIHFAQETFQLQEMRTHALPVEVLPNVDPESEILDTIESEMLRFPNQVSILFITAPSGGVGKSTFRQDIAATFLSDETLLASLRQERAVRIYHVTFGMCLAHCLKMGFIDPEIKFGQWSIEDYQTVSRLYADILYLSQSKLPTQTKEGTPVTSLVLAESFTGTLGVGPDIFERLESYRHARVLVLLPNAEVQKKAMEERDSFWNEEDSELKIRKTMSNTEFDVDVKVADLRRMMGNRIALERGNASLIDNIMEVKSQLYTIDFNRQLLRSNSNIFKLVAAAYFRYLLVDQAKMTQDQFWIRENPPLRVPTIHSHISLGIQNPLPLADVLRSTRWMRPKRKKK